MSSFIDTLQSGEHYVCKFFPYKIRSINELRSKYLFRSQRIVNNPGISCGYQSEVFIHPKDEFHKSLVKFISDEINCPIDVERVKININNPGVSNLKDDFIHKDTEDHGRYSFILYMNTCDGGTFVHPSKSVYSIKGKSIIIRADDLHSSFNFDKNKERCICNVVFKLR